MVSPVAQGSSGQWGKQAIGQVANSAYTGELYLWFTIYQSTYLQGSSVDERFAEEGEGEEQINVSAVIEDS